MEKKQDNEDSLHDGGSLEFSDAEAAVKNSSVIEDDKSSGSSHSRGMPGPMRRFWDKFNIYMLMFIFLVIVAGVLATSMYLKNKTDSVVIPGTIKQQNLPAAALDDLAQTGVQVGDPKQVLNVQSNSVFAGAVLVKGELQVAGGMKIGSGSLAIPELDVGGSATINSLQAQTVGIEGAARIGDLSVLRNLSVTGNSTFSGSLTTSALSVGRLQLNGDLTVARHIVANGATPGRANGSALGGGGTTSVSGSDIAGSLAINTGSSPAAGCFASINFVTPYSSTPTITITPIGSAAASVQYYVNRNTTGFSVCTASPAPGNASFGFDYHIIE